MLLLHLGYAQNINTTLAADINVKFAPLEKNRIPHNILLDYGFDLIDVPQFDGVLRTNNYIDVERYNLIYNSIVSSATQFNVSGIAAPKVELNKWKVLQKQQNDIAKFNNKAIVVLNGLFYNYSKINANALSSNKIQVINDAYDDKYINNVWQNPYDNKQAFAITSSVIMLNKSTVDVVLPSTLWHTNATVTDIAIDFGNNTGYKSLTNASVATTTYTTVGVFTWTYRIFTNGQYKYCRQKVKVNQADAPILARNAACGAPQVVNITATKPYQGVLGSATLQIIYGGTCGQLRKPLIVAEGLDTGLLAQGGTIGDSDINSFFTSVTSSFSTELQDYITNNTAVDYDIVYVNWNNGVDFIQRNAYVLEAVIKYVNDRKALVGSTEKNVVLGQSMGGLITRYALRDMENNSLNHDTKLYISHDAPHQGAHIPPGILHMGRHIANEFLQTPLGGIEVPLEGGSNLSLATIDDLLDAPAINQLLISTVNTSGNRTNTSHLNWQTELRNIGYPQQTRNIALSNASHCAAPQGITSNKELVSVTGNGGTSDFTSLVEFFLFLGPLVGDFFNDTSTFLLGFLPGNSSLDVEFRAKAFPATSIAQIYKGRLTYKKTFLWLVPITRTIFNVTKNSQVGDLFVDNFPGGTNPNAIFENSSNYESNFFFNYGFNVNIDLNFDFIPVTSALDVSSGNTTLSELDYFTKYTSANPPTGNKAIPFANFSTSYNTNSLNEPHISFNRRNGNWLATELDTNPNNNDVFSCLNFCSNAQIIGSDYLCNSGTYSVTSEANPATTNWSITEGNNLVNFTTNGNQITLNQTNQSGYVTISVVYGNDRCGTTTTPVLKRIWVGIPQYLSQQITNGYDNVPINSTSTLNILPVQGAKEYYWWIIENSNSCGCTTDSEGLTLCPAGTIKPKFTANNDTYSYTSTSPTVNINWGNCSGNYIVNVAAKNPCGLQGINHKVVNVYSTSGGGGGGNDPCAGRLVVFPNPVNKNGSTAIDFEANIAYPGDPCNNNPTLERINNEVKIYDFYGNVVFENRYDTDLMKISNINLTRGNYVLNVFTNKDYEIREIIVVE